MGAGPASAETSMEARIARLESDVAHLRSDVGDIKVDVRAVRDKMDGMNTKLSERIDGVGAQLNAKIDSLGAQLNAKIDGAKIWALALYIALAAAMFGTMARGFQWI